MSILIPGKMPTRCWDCPMCYDMMACTLTGLNWYRDTVDLSINPVEERMPNCPLIELPPHSRLIDADALMAEFERMQKLNDTRGHEFACSFMSSSMEISTEWYCVEDAVNAAKTIIPADPEDKEEGW